MFTLAGASLFSGCGTTPSPLSMLGQIQETAPQGWASSSSEAKAGMDLKWVGQFDSPELERLLKQAAERNLDLKVASARRSQALRDIQLAKVAGNPSLDLRFLPQRQKQNFIGFPLGGNVAPNDASPEVSSNITNSYRLTGELQWEIDLWGRIRAATGAAVAVAQAAEADFKAAQASVGASVVRAWLLVKEHRLQAELAGRAEAAAQDTAKALEERFRAGQEQAGGSLGAQLRLARADAASAAATRTERELAMRQGQRALEELCGVFPKAEKMLGAGELPILKKRPPAGVPSELLLRRPDILAAERRYAAQGLRRKEAKLAVFPRLNLVASLGGSSEALRSVLASDYGIWSLGGGVVQSVLTGGQVPAELGKRKDQEEESLSRLQKTVLGAFREVEDALDADQALAAQEQSLAEATRLASEADSEARADFKRGLGDILTVLQSQQRAIQAETALWSVRRARLENRVQLHLALGGDFR